MSQLVRLEGKHTTPNGHCALHRQVSLDNVDHIDHVDDIDDVPPLHRQVCLDNVDHFDHVDVIDDVPPLHRHVCLVNVDHIDHVDVIDDVPQLHRQVCLDIVDHIGSVDVIDDVNDVIVDVTQYHYLKVRPPSFMLYLYLNLPSSSSLRQFKLIIFVIKENIMMLYVPRQVIIVLTQLEGSGGFSIAHR